MNLNKKAQLGIIEFKFMMIGLVVGIILALVLVYLGNSISWLKFLRFVC